MKPTKITAGQFEVVQKNMPEREPMRRLERVAVA